MARAYTHTRNNKRVGWTGILESRYVSLRDGILSSLNSGLLYCSYSLWVGIRLFNTRHPYGVCRAWSIWTMPAILRIFLYQTDASLLCLGLCEPYDQGADLSRPVWSGTLWGVDLIGISCTASSQRRTMLWSLWGTGLCSLLASCQYVFGVRR